LIDFKKLIRRLLSLLNTNIRNTLFIIKEKLKGNFDNFSTFLIKKWLFLWGWVLRIYYKIKTIVKFALVVNSFLLLAYIFFRYYQKSVLIQNSIIEGNLNISFSTFFTTIGAAILGVLAITFSLSLFALQQAADKYTSAVLSDFLKDKTSRIIFWLIALISIVFFIFAILPLKNILLLKLILTFILLIILFILLRKQYFHITTIINPNYQIISHRNRAISKFNEVDKLLDVMIRIGAIKPGENQQRSKNEDK